MTSDKGKIKFIEFRLFLALKKIKEDIPLSCAGPGYAKTLKVKEQHFKLKIWNCGPITVWHNLTCVKQFSFNFSVVLKKCEFKTQSPLWYLLVPAQVCLNLCKSPFKFKTLLLPYLDDLVGQHLPHPGRPWRWRRQQPNHRRRWQWQGLVVAPPPGAPELEDGGGRRVPCPARLRSHSDGNDCLPPPLSRGRSGRMHQFFIWLPSWKQQQNCKHFDRLETCVFTSSIIINGFVCVCNSVVDPHPNCLRIRHLFFGSGSVFGIRKSVRLRKKITNYFLIVSFLKRFKNKFPLQILNHKKMYNITLAPDADANLI